MNKALDKIKQAWEENPLQVIVVGALAATAASKLIDSMAAAKNTSTWAKEVDRRRMATLK
jgi:hypothetical protein